MTATLDKTKLDEFADRMMRLLDDGMLSLMTSIGHHSGLFDVLAKVPPSASSTSSTSGAGPATRPT